MDDTLLLTARPAATGGTLRGPGGGTPAESFAGAGSLDVTVTVTGASS